VVAPADSTLAAFSADDPSLTAAPVDREADSAIDRSPEHPEHPEHGGPCIRHGTLPAALQAERVQALASEPDRADGPALASDPAERPDSYRLPAKRREHSVPARMRAAAGNSIRRPKKAR